MSTPVAISQSLLSRTRKRLLAWYDANRRDLPWRHSRDPYAIWISETMLQQTRVDTVIPYYERFLERFPDVPSLADAELEDVYSSWTGLGYYSRARNLHAAARTLVAEHGGRLPDEIDALRSLRGIGRYTAGALASIAFGRSEPVVDGNVVRVLARCFGVREDVGERSVIEGFWQLAGRLVRGPRPGDLNQALMELGATLCTPRGPRCPDCPLRTVCSARERGDAEVLPRTAPRRAAVRVEAVAAWLARRGRVLAVQRPAKGLLAGLWELPGGELLPGERPEAGLRRHLGERLGLELGRAERVGEVEHLFTHRRLRLHVFRVSQVSGRVRCIGFAGHRWVSASQLALLPHGGPTRKALALLGQGSPRSHRERLRAARPRASG